MDAKIVRIALGATMLALSSGSGIAGTDITAASIAVGRLFVLGQTERPNTAVILEDQFETTSNEKGTFQFEETYYPQRCIVKVTVEGKPYEAVVSNCGQANVACDLRDDRAKNASVAPSVAAPSVNKVPEQINQIDGDAFERLRKQLDDKRMKFLEDKAKTVNSLSRKDTASAPLPPLRPLPVETNAEREATDKPSAHTTTATPAVKEAPKTAALIGTRNAEAHPQNLKDLNAASLDELNSLKGGGAIGRTIIQHRPYRNVDDLLTKRVLNQTSFKAIKDQVAVRPDSPSSARRH